MEHRKMIFNNAESTAVREAVAGLLITRGDLKLLARTNNVIVRADIDEYRQDHVTIICGGGSGHEPAHAGYIGDGMLSCAVLGNVFASPSVDSVYTAIKACASPIGVLVIVKNYTGDRLNFGMAVEKAKSEGMKACMIIVGDDCTAVTAGSITGRRGVAGTLLVQKVAGAKAHYDRGSLEQVHAVAMAASDAVRTMGIGLTCCNLPGKPKSDRLNGLQMEVGIGIHGEAGRSVQETPTEGLATLMAQTITDALLDDITAASQRTSIGEVAVMVNNLGTTTELEMCSFVASLIPMLVSRGAIVLRLYMGAFMTALDMHGVSVTLCDLSVGSDVTRLLDLPTSAPAWKPSSLSGLSQDVEEEVVIPTDACTVELDDTLLAEVSELSAMVQYVCAQLIEAEPMLTELDSICGDGDCGLTVKSASERVLEKLQQGAMEKSSSNKELLLNVRYANTCTYLATNASASMGGTLGAVMELLLRAMANYYHASSLEDLSLGSALQAGIDAVMFYGGAKVGMRTMLDALYPAVTILKEGGTLAAAADAAETGAISTGSMVSLAGRSSYVNPDAIEGVQDPGARAVAIALRAAASFKH